MGDVDVAGKAGCPTLVAGDSWPGCELPVNQGAGAGVTAGADDEVTKPSPGFAEQIPLNTMFQAIRKC